VCLPVGCGNGVVEPQLNEVCDDGNRTSLDGCSANCLSAETCGDGAVDTALGEQCDCGMPGQTVAGCASANSNDPGASCRTDCKLARCGDGTVDPAEVCDDGNNAPGDGCRADCRGRWTAMTTGTFADLYAVWGSSPTNVYAVGNDSTIVHYDGTKWTQVQTSGPIDYSDVWGSGTTDVFAVGYAVNSNAGRVDRFNGLSFSSMHLYASNVFVSTIHGQSATDFWVGGANSNTNTPVLQRYTGGGWPAASSTCTGVTAGFASIWTDASGKAWAVSGNGDLCAFNGVSTWTKAASVDLRALWGVSATELYGTNDSTGTVELSTNGTSWSPVPGVPSAMEPENVGGVAGDIVIVGRDGSIVMFDGVSTRVEQAPLPFHLRDVWIYDKNHAFIVGDNGTILY
jgi:cysteine-rich repeat protein